MQGYICMNVVHKYTYDTHTYVVREMYVHMYVCMYIYYLDVYI